MSGASDGRAAGVVGRFLRVRQGRAGLVLLGLLAATALAADVLAADLPLFLRYRGETFFLPALARPAALRALPPGALEASLGPADLAVFPPVRRGPETVDLGARLAPPSAAHPLGTDGTGRDVLARLIHGSRVALAVGLIAVAIELALGLAVGAAAGYLGGGVDLVLSRAVEAVLVLPTLLVVLAVTGTVGALSPPAVGVVIGLCAWPGVARLVRGEILRIRELDYVLAARALGASPAGVVLRHVLPNALGPALVAAAFGLSGAILWESALSFLGFGVRPPTATWGELLAQAHEHAIAPGAWWLALFPGAAIFLAVAAGNLAGEGLRRALDPRDACG
jgi:peptide/nickel transport system permease protein